MVVSYNKLWKLLIDKDMKKKDLQSIAGISWSSVTKFSKRDKGRASEMLSGTLFPEGTYDEEAYFLCGLFCRTG